jgi:hypothetical protein
MLTSNAPLWPQFTAKEGDANSAGDPWGLGAAMETQARLWNHLLDANRSFWSFYTPWLQTTPWMWNTALAPLEREDAPEEPEAKTADGIPDALETQARSWNRFLDAQRGFWTAVNWPVPGAPWMNGEIAAEEEAPAKPAPRARTAARKTRSARK